jgi:hypothetical protein
MCAAMHTRTPWQKQWVNDVHHLLLCTCNGRRLTRSPRKDALTPDPESSSMSDLLRQLASALQASSLHDGMIWLLTNIPGFPPIVQTIHIVAIAAIMGSIVLVSLRVLGLAFPRQQIGEMARRLMPWTWWALPVLLISGLVFVMARPRRYFVNPVFGIKFALLVPAIACALLLHRLAVRESTAVNGFGRPVLIKAVAGLSLLLWLGVAMAGRWIAYADYLFPPE